MTTVNELSANLFNNRIFVNVIIIAIIILLFWWGSGMFDDESYSPIRERSDQQSDFNIFEEVEKIRKQQKANLNNMSQMSSYNINI